VRYLEESLPGAYVRERPDSNSDNRQGKKNVAMRLTRGRGSRFGMSVRNWMSWFCWAEPKKEDAKAVNRLRQPMARSIGGGRVPAP